MCSQCDLGYHQANGRQHRGLKECCALCSQIAHFETKDSGERQQYDSGMQRDTEAGKPRFSLMLPKGVPYEEQFLTRFAALLARGAEKYDSRNWEKAEGDLELERYHSSAFRHLIQWIAGETDEDHAAAVAFNLMAAETVKFKQRQKRQRDLFLHDRQDVLPC